LCKELLKKNRFGEEGGFLGQIWSPAHTASTRYAYYQGNINIHTVYVPAAAFTKEKLLQRGEMGLENRPPGNRTRQIM
jgi:hypothetical protein